MKAIRIAAFAGGTAAVAAIITTIASADQISHLLTSAYSYPNPSGTSLGEAASSTLTYLFAAAGVAVLASLISFSDTVSQSRAGRWTGGVLIAVGFAVAIFNAAQPEFPPAVKLVFFLPPAAGALWLGLATRRRAEPRTSRAL
ncbi:hypothetical protein KTJ89_12410 [Brevibacterium sediminis]|uniref:hypothetical protein n=1 Tax=Brevibacterium sediminis TaxID=1857024 RepID=UPI002174F7F2|nr:hypothetical protein [Brevibacterium sediminis]MCS4593782.1 hypothetical protein [Brevibacterium sediminis]